jgi:hypothetical protein
MNHNDRLFHIAMVEFVLKQAEMQSAFTKLVVVRLQNLENRLRMRARLEQLQDSEEKSAIADDLSTLERSTDSSAETMVLKDFLARQESEHEKMGAVLKTLRASLPPPPDDPATPGPA